MNEQVLSRLRISKADIERSYDWYMKQVKLLSATQLTPNMLMKSDLGKPVRNLDVGSMYMFVYDPKLKVQLPVYDRFPLVFPFTPTDDGFIGINLHYLPYRMRATMLNRLYSTANNTKLTPKTKLRLSWDLLNSVSRFPGVRSCVKRYLNGHVRSRFLRVNPIDWKITIFLQTEDFAKMSKEQVFRQTRRNA